MTPSDKEFRKTLIEKRRQTADREAAQRQIAARLLPFLQEARNGCIGIYLPVQGEADILSYLPADLNMAAPVVTDRKNGVMEFRRIENFEKDLKKGAFGILEPADHCKKTEPDLILAPMVAFCGTNRMGYGGGFYDRYLAAHPNAKTIGLAFEVQQADFTAQPHDIALDLVITEARILEKSGE